MSIRNRTTKLLARRHDLNYFKRMSPIRAWQWGLAVVALVCAVVWFGETTLRRGNSAFSSGPMSSSHAVFGQRCEVCHVPVIAKTSWTPSFGLRNHVPDSACLKCHAASAHHPMETKETPSCSSCHTEHVGAMHLAATPDRGCTQCHANLETKSGALAVARNVGSFAHEHPDFRALRTVSANDRAAALALRFNHAGHMHPDLSSLHGPVTLTCQSCHFAELNENHRTTGNFTPVSFDKSCRTCHSLEFDTHIHEEAPHASVDKVQAFVVQQITAYAQAHPDVVAIEIRNWPAEAMLPGKFSLGRTGLNPAQLNLPAPHSTSEWIANRVARADTILWREKCGLCHKDLNRSSAPPEPTLPADLDPGASQATLTLASMPLPRIEPSQQPAHWFGDAVFSHTAHQAEECSECHQKALTSSSGSDLLMPSIATCRRCHDGQTSPQGPPVKTGHAESGCFLCHYYHGAAPANFADAHLIAELMRK